MSSQRDARLPRCSLATSGHLPNASAMTSTMVGILADSRSEPPPRPHEFRGVQPPPAAPQPLGWGALLAVVFAAGVIYIADSNETLWPCRQLSPRQPIWTTRWLRRQHNQAMPISRVNEPAGPGPKIVRRETCQIPASISTLQKRQHSSP
jgi:hypothetical protein